MSRLKIGTLRKTRLMLRMRAEHHQTEIKKMTKTMRKTRTKRMRKRSKNGWKSSGKRRKVGEGRRQPSEKRRRCQWVTALSQRLMDSSRLAGILHIVLVKVQGGRTAWLR
jgi:hypothetical protein